MSMQRRRFLAAGSGVGAAFLAGCAAAEQFAVTDDGTDDEAEASSDDSTGNFRLLISDQPNAIGDFAELNVSFSTARVFRADAPDAGDAADEEVEDVDDVDDETDDTADDGAEDDPDDEESDAVDDGGDTEDSDDGDDEADENPDDEGDGDDAADETQSEDDIEFDDADDEDGQGDDPEGWVEIDLDGATVDLTEVIGDKAIPIVETELEEGRYSSIHLEVAEVEGIAAESIDDEERPEEADTSEDGSDDDGTADGAGDDEDERERLTVHVPSDRLRLVRPFEVVSDEELSFVFDINVIRRGRQREYNLKPVIGKSGVVGEDVEAEEISPGEGGPEEGEGPGNADDRGGRPDDRGPPDDRGNGRGRSDDSSD